jgi:hypothetical protein
MPLPEAITLELEAIDAALAGDAVDPEFADLAELALLLSDTRPEIPPDAATRLDRHVSGLAADRRTRRLVARAHRSAARPRRSWLLRPAGGAGLAGLAAVGVVVVVITSGGGSRSSFNSAFTPAAPHADSQSLQKATSTSAAGTAASPARGASTSSGSAGSSSSSAGAGSSRQASPLSTLSPVVKPPTPALSGQKIVQSSELTLTAPSDRINEVAQELFDTVGAEQGFVKHSSVTSGSGGSASFSLSIPTANLSAALSRLTALRYSRVSSSTESTTDVTSSYQDDQRALADAKALHTSLLKQLAAAYTSEQVDSLNAQIKDDETAITADEKSLTALQGRISYTSVSVEIDAGSIAVPPGTPVGGGGGFSLHKAGHDAVRVLVVVAGVALIALAVLLPLTLLVAFIAWAGFGWRRRRRESMLDRA